MRYHFSFNIVQESPLKVKTLVLYLVCRLLLENIWRELVINKIIESVHDGHVGGPKQYNDFPLGNIFYCYANICSCFSPPTWPQCTHSIGVENNDY